MKFALCNELYGKRPFEEVCDHVASCGYDAIEIAPFTFNDDPALIDQRQAEQAGATARAAGLPVVGLHWLLAKPDGLHLTCPDAAVRRHTVQFMHHLARLCAAMGGKFLVLGSPKQRELLEGMEYEDAFARMADGLHQVCQTAGSLGLKLLIEPLAPTETNFINTAAEGVRMMRMIDHPAAGLHLDVKAMSSEKDPIDKVILDHAEHLIHFHANDQNGRGPGFGKVDFVPIARALHKVRYNGYVSVEVFDFLPDPETIAVKSIEYLNRTFGKESRASGEARASQATDAGTI